MNITRRSVVLPAWNEAESLRLLLPELRQVLEAPDFCQSYEVVVVDDGSTDETSKVVLEFAERWPELRLISLRRNLGQTHALSVGFQDSKGEIVFALDADGQNDPRDIPVLEAQLLELNVDCLSGWRKHRVGDKGLRVYFSRFANSLLMKASQNSIHDSGCTLKAYRGDSIRSIDLFGDMHRLIPFNIELAGGTVAEIEVAHRGRHAGKSKYSLARTFRVAQDIAATFFIKRFSHRPIHLVGAVGMFLFLLGLVVLGIAGGLKLFLGLDFVESPLTLFAMILLTSGLNTLWFGLLAELLNRNTLKSKSRYPLAYHARR